MNTQIIRQYTLDYKTINSKLRRGLELDVMEKEFVQQLNECLGRLKCAHPRLSFRGQKAPELFSNQFLSTTIDMEQAQNFGPYIFRVIGYGCWIQPYSAYQFEMEVLYPSTTQFEKFEDEEGEVWVEVIPGMTSAEVVSQVQWTREEYEFFGLTHPDDYL